MTLDAQMMILAMMERASDLEEMATADRKEPEPVLLVTALVLREIAGIIGTLALKPPSNASN